MVRAASGGTAIERLLSYLFDGAPSDSVAAEMRGWLADSPRFRVFAEANRDKIRKKLRGAADAEARGDVRAELRAAQRLLADRRIDLAFEAYGSGRRGPDFTIAFRGERSFNLEVTRPRAAPDEGAFARLLLAKLRQLPPSVPNALLVALPGRESGAAEVGAAELIAAAVRALRARADLKDDAFFHARDVDGSRGFYDRFLRLGAVVGWREAALGDARAEAWTNASARIPLPERAMRACVTCLRLDDILKPPPGGATLRRP